MLKCCEYLWYTRNLFPIILILFYICSFCWCWAPFVFYSSSPHPQNFIFFFFFVSAFILKKEHHPHLFFTLLYIRLLPHFSLKLWMLDVAFQAERKMIDDNCIEGWRKGCTKYYEIWWWQYWLFYIVKSVKSSSCFFLFTTKTWNLKFFLQVTQLR